MRRRPLGEKGDHYDEKGSREQESEEECCSQCVCVCVTSSIIDSLRHTQMIKHLSEWYLFKKGRNPLQT